MCVHIAAQFVVFIAIDSDIDDDGSGFDHVASNHARASDGGNENVGLTRKVLKVLCSAVGNSGIALQKQEGGRFSDDVAASDDQGVFPFRVDARLIDHAHDAGRCAGDEPFALVFADKKAPGVEGVKSVDVFIRSNCRNDFFGANMSRNRKLHEDAVDGFVLIELFN